jgi:endoglucanase
MTIQSAANLNRVPEFTGDRTDPAELLAWLAGIPTAPYHEDGISAGIHRIAAEIGLVAISDDDGNVQVWHRGAGSAPRRPIVVSAHMDHPALEVTGVAPLRGRLLGSIRAESFSEPTPVRFFWLGDDGWKDAAGLVTGATPLDNDPDSRVALSLSSDGDVPLGAFGTFDFGPVRWDAHGRLHSTACDDLAGCAITLAWLAQCARDGVQADSGGVFTRAEEVGLVGAAALASRRGLPEDALVVSIEASRELPGATMGNGPVIRVGDAATTFHPAGDAFFRAARDAMRVTNPNVQVQRQLMSGGVCEGTTYTAAGYITGAVCVPLGNYHNQRPEGGLGAEYVHVDDLRGCAALLRATSGLIAAGFDWPNDDPLSQRYLVRPTSQFERLRRSAPRQD